VTERVLLKNRPKVGPGGTAGSGSLHGKKKPLLPGLIGHKLQHSRPGYAQNDKGKQDEPTIKSSTGWPLRRGGDKRPQSDRGNA